MANRNHPANDPLSDFIDDDLAEDLEELSRSRASGYASTPNSAPTSETEELDDEGEGDDVTRDQEVFRYQLYFSHQARLFAANNTDNAVNENAADDPSLLPADYFGTNYYADDGDSGSSTGSGEWRLAGGPLRRSSSDDDDEDTNTPQFTSMPPRLPPPHRRVSRRHPVVGQPSDGGRPMLDYALQNWRKERALIVAERMKADADRLEQEVRLEDRVLGLDGAARWRGLALQKDDQNHLVDAQSDAVMKDTFDYRKLAAAGARRERILRENPAAGLEAGDVEFFF